MSARRQASGRPTNASPQGGAPRQLARVAARLFNSPLAVLPDVAQTIAANLEARFGGGAMQSRPNRADDDAPREPEPYLVVDGVAIVAVRGELISRGSWLDAESGLTSYERLTAALRQAGDDPLVRAVLLDMDSPGGEAAGMVETAAFVRALAARKPVTAFVNGAAASAAYALAAGASEIVVTPSAMVGSIGVICLHMDYSRALAAAGLKPTLIHAGAFKADGNAYEPLADPARGRIQAMIDDIYRLFVASVGAHRPKLGAAGARKTEAAVFMGQKAVDAGLADRVGTLDDAFASLRRPAASGARRAPAATAPPAAVQLSPPAPEPASAPAPRPEGALATERCAAILCAPEARGIEDFARHLALKTSLTAEEAIGLLRVQGAAEAAGRRGSRMALVPKPAVIADARVPEEFRSDASRRAETDKGWGEVADKLNRQAGAQQIKPA